MEITVNQKQEIHSMTILQRIARNDQTAVADCINCYSDQIWTMARNLTNSVKETENLVKEIFLDIWRYAARFEATDFDEIIFITIITRRCLIERSKKLSKQSTNKGKI